MIFTTNSEAYLNMLDQIEFSYNHRPFPRGLETLEKLNMQFTVNFPSSKQIITKDLKRNEVIGKYLLKEFEWYDSGNVMANSAPAPFWKTLADREGRINSNYGHLIFHDESEGSPLEWSTSELLGTCTSTYFRTPFEWALLSLLNDVETRQAIMRINKAKHAYVGNKDLPCTMYLNFHIRSGLLYTTVRMRSNDLTTGLVYDLPYFSKVAEDMVKEYNDNVDAVNKIHLGPLTFSADSMHIYAKDLNKVHKMAGRAQ